MRSAEGDDPVDVSADFTDEERAADEQDDANEDGNGVSAADERTGRRAPLGVP
jgi:hypothetical protein